MRALRPTFGRFPPSTSTRSRRLTLAKAAACVEVSCASFRRARIAAPSGPALLIVGLMGRCYVKGTFVSCASYCYIYVTVVRSFVKGFYIASRLRLRLRARCASHGAVERGELGAGDCQPQRGQIAEGGGQGRRRSVRSYSSQTSRKNAGRSAVSGAPAAAGCHVSVPSRISGRSSPARQRSMRRASRSTIQYSSECRW